MNADRKLLYQHVEFLTTLRPFRNRKNLESLERVCDYLKNEFRKYGLEPAEQKFPVKGPVYKNTLASYNTEKQRRLIVGAHYDVCGDQPGADDNASAVAGLLEVARMVADAQPNIDYRIDFVSYCLEEPPCFCTRQMGSWIHAESLEALKADIIGVINFEMIGYFNEGDQSYRIHCNEMPPKIRSCGRQDTMECLSTRPVRFRDIKMRVSMPRTSFSDEPTLDIRPIKRITRKAPAKNGQSGLIPLGSGDCEPHGLVAWTPNRQLDVSVVFFVSMIRHRHCSPVEGPRCSRFDGKHSTKFWPEIRPELFQAGRAGFESAKPWTPGRQSSVDNLPTK